MTEASRARWKVLIIEDESLVAMLIEDVLRDLGCEIVAIAGRLEQAVRSAHELEFDLAIVDLNLNGERTELVPPILRSRGIPFVFATGYGTAGVSEQWRDIPLVQKPFQPEELAAAVSRAMRA